MEPMTMLAIAGVGSTVLGGIAGYEQNKANAIMAQTRTLAKRDALERRIDKLMRVQRQTIGTAKAVMAKGGGYGQDQTLMLEGMMMNRMARDMAELEYKKDIVGIEGEYEAEYFESAAIASIVGATGQAAGQAYNGYMAHRDAA